jgi:hypothetical protein
VLLRHDLLYRNDRLVCRLSDENEVAVKVMYKAVEEYIHFSEVCSTSLADLQALAQKEYSDAYKSASEEVESEEM